MSADRPETSAAAQGPRDPGGPDDGHTFRLVVTSRMSSTVVGDAHHTDADHFGPPWTLDVRAWSLPAALRKAAEVPLVEWGREEDEEESSPKPVTER